MADCGLLASEEDAPHASLASSGVSEIEVPGSPGRGLGDLRANVIQFDCSAPHWVLR